MAESVDALVSNTNGAIRPGSIPGQGTQSGWQLVECQPLLFILWAWGEVSDGE